MKLIQFAAQGPLAPTFLLICASVVMDGCAKDDAPVGAPPPSSSVSAEGACALLTTSEVAILANTDGAGVYESVGGQLELCSWPDADEPTLILQVGPSSPDGVLAAVQLGEGYRSFELADTNETMAASVEEGDSALVAVLALELGARTIVLSPLGSPISYESAEFEKLKEILMAAASRI